MIETDTGIQEIETVGTPGEGKHTVQMLFIVENAHNFNMIP